MIVVVTALVKPHQLDAVARALAQFPSAEMSVTEVRGFGRQGGHSETYRGAEYTIDLVPKARVDVVCDEDESDDVVDAVVTAARTGRIGDGKVWVSPVDQVTPLAARNARDR